MFLPSFTYSDGLGLDSVFLKRRFLALTDATLNFSIANGTCVAGLTTATPTSTLVPNRIGLNPVLTMLTEGGLDYDAPSSGNDIEVDLSSPTTATVGDGLLMEFRFLLMGD